jgi:hypothetical protein
MRVDFVPAAMAEAKALPARERQALAHAVEKLRVKGDRLAFPHSSAVRGAAGTLRELRPRGGASRWRALYCRVGDAFVIAAVGPEAEVDQRGFDRAVRLALARLAAEEQSDG